MLKEYLPLSQIQQIESVESWQKAVEAVAKPLLDNGSIEPKYLERILQLTGEIGPYYVIAPEIAMPHSRPEDGVLKQALSLVVLKQGVNFGSENDPVKIVLMLAAKDNNSHIEMLSAVAELFSDEEAVQQIIQASDIQTISEVVYRY